MAQIMHYIYSRMTNNNNNNEFRGNEMLDFNNGIFKTENETLKSGRVITHIDNVKTGERVCYVDTQADLDWSINKLMERRLVETGGRLWV